MNQSTLSNLITVHCFAYPRCKHTEVACDPISAHDQMEAHYAAKHSLLLGSYPRPGDQS